MPHWLRIVSILSVVAWASSLIAAYVACTTRRLDEWGRHQCIMGALFAALAAIVWGGVVASSPFISGKMALMVSIAEFTALFLWINRFKMWANRLPWAHYAHAHAEAAELARWQEILDSIDRGDLPIHLLRPEEMRAIHSYLAVPGNWPRTSQAPQTSSN